MTRPAPIIAGTLAALVLLFGAYMGSYYANLGGEAGYSPYQKYPVPPGEPLEFSKPIYYVKWLESFFLPAHFLDRVLRPSVWPDAYWHDDAGNIPPPPGFFD